MLGRIEEVESKLRRLEGEWTDAYEKLARLADRVRKRAAREMERATSPDVNSETGPSENGGEVARELTPWEKRRRRVSGPGGC